MGLLRELRRLLPQVTSEPKMLRPASFGAKVRTRMSMSEGRAAAPPHFENAFTPMALQEAWRKVRANGGAPGPDRQTLDDFERELERNLELLAREMRGGNYKPQPALRVWLPKAGGEPGEVRPISILNVRDRVVQRAAHGALSPFYESRFLECSFGFRESRGVREAVAEVVRLRESGLHCVVDGDIRKCFEMLEHDVLLRLLERDLGDVRYVQLIERWLRVGVLGSAGRRAQVEAQVRGVGQGAAISPLLANVYLHEFDVVMCKARRALVRYADDWVILCRGREDAERALEEARHALLDLRLVVNPHKTRITDFDTGWSFLGAFFVRDEQYWVNGK